MVEIRRNPRKKKVSAPKTAMLQLERDDKIVLDGYVYQVRRAVGTRLLLYRLGKK